MIRLQPKGGPALHCHIFCSFVTFEFASFCTNYLSLLSSGIMQTQRITSW